MSFELFDFDSDDGLDQETAIITVASGEFGRVRFTKKPKTAKVVLQIVANGLTTESLVDDIQGWATGVLSAGDDVKLIVRFSGSSIGETVSGILEVQS